MPDLAPPGAADRLGLARAVRGEVVVVYVALGILRADRIEPLSIARCPERRHGHDLRLPTREDRRTVDARQHADLGPDRANLRQRTPVGPLAPLQNPLAPRLGLQVLKDPEAALRPRRLLRSFQPRRH